MASNETTKEKIRHWINVSPDYNKGKNVISKANPLYVASIKTLIDEGRTVEFPVRGWSMRIFVEHERDKAILKKVAPEDLKEGDVVLARIEAEKETYVLHRIIKIDKDTLTLMGDGNIASTETSHKKDVIAIATGFIRKNKQKPDYVTSRKWRLYSKVWVALCPIRRYLLLLWRIAKRLHIIS